MLSLDHSTMHSADACNIVVCLFVDKIVVGQVVIAVIS